MYKNKQRNKIGTHLSFPICLFCVPMSSFLFTLYSFNVSFEFSCTDFIHTDYFVQCSLCYVLFLLLSLLSFSLSDCLYFWPYFIVFFPVRSKFHLRSHVLISVALFISFNALLCSHVLFLLFLHAVFNTTVHIQTLPCEATYSVYIVMYLFNQIITGSSSTSHPYATTLDSLGIQAR